MKKGVECIGVTVTYFCHDGKGNFAMLKRGVNARDENGRWDIGAGGIEHGETVIDTLHKEIKEEYSTDVLDFEFLGYRDVHRTHEDQPTHWIALDFKVLVDRDRVKIGEPHKFDDLGWFTFDTYPKNCHSQFPEFLRLYRDRL